SETSYGDFEDSFILSDVKLFYLDEGEPEVDDETGELINRLPAFDSSINFNGTYFFKYDGCDNWDSPLGANTMKWHIMAAPAYIKQITVPSDYNTSDNYSASNFVKTEETELTREYYTNAAYEGKYFAALNNSEGAGFEIISSDINKKMVIIDANHEGEDDINTGTGAEAAPKYNRAANIFLPISYGQYAMTGGTAENINFLVKITFKAVRLEGDSAPVIGRIVGKKGKSSGRGSQALCKAAYNIPIGDYASNAETYNETYKDSEGNRLKCEYDAETGEFTGWMRVRCADNDYASRWGCNEVITIGNAEHVWAAGGKFDSTSFNSSFAISNIKVDLYECGSGYVRSEMIAEDIAPHLYADTLDTTSRWAYQFRNDGSYDCSNNDYDCIRAPQNLWSAEGNVGMVHTENLTACMAAGHTVTYHERTDTTREYWTCSCGKNFSDAFCKTEIFDTSAKKQIIYIAASENPATAFIPIKLCGFENERWFKFTCKCKLIGGESIPVVTTLYNQYWGQNECLTTKSGDDMAVYAYSYDPETYTLTAYIFGWIKDIIGQKDRFPFERMNAVSGANMAILIGNGRYIGAGYDEQNSDTDFAIAEPELYMLDCTEGTSGFENAKAAEAVSGNLITPMTDKTIDLESEYVAVWNHVANPLAAPQGKWYVTGKDKANISTKNLPANYFTADYVECTHENTATEAAVASTCHTQGHSEYKYCTDCGEILEGSDALLPLDPNNHEGETEVRDAVEATCAAHGYSGDTYCLGCGAKIADGEETDYAEHTVGDWLTDDTYHWHYCSVCEGTLDQAEHTYEWVVTKEATAEENGLKEEICSVCGHKSGNQEEIEYSSHTAGDINGDGAVNNKDLTRLFQYLSDWDVEVDESALDVNGDGSVNNKDLTRLFQYLSDWDVEIF
ncbi:MAG: dockerin type I repeat-containing protein, partial [Clostridia bacterium]|nr:dockerin type I repeat-containing protein [Clostridia bacterium]